MPPGTLAHAGTECAPFLLILAQYLGSILEECGGDEPADKVGHGARHAPHQRHFYRREDPAFVREVSLAEDRVMARSTT